MQSIKNSLNFSVAFIGLSSLTLPYLFTKLINHEKLVYIVSSILLVFLFSFHVILKKKGNLKFELFFNLSERINLYLYFLILFIFTFITQNVYLDFETISWDVASYLVASLQIGEGSIPYETQWESKGPLLMYVYYFITKLSSNSYVVFRLLNDFILFLISILLFKSVLKQSNKKIYAFISSILFLSIFSDPEYISEFSELYTLFLVALSYYFFINKSQTYKNLFIIGLIISAASLINQVAGIFLIPYLIEIYKSKNDLRKKLLYLLLGVLVPAIFFQIIYLINGLYDILLINYVIMPLGYSSSGDVNAINELRIWIREFYHYNKFLYFSIITVLIIEILRVIRPIKIELFKSSLYINIFVSLAVYFLGSHSYSHHLIYFVYFVCFLILNIDYKEKFILVFSFILIASGSIFMKSFEKGSQNIINYQEIQSNYPVYKLSQEIDEHIDDKSSIFALEYVLILFYLERPNFSYIVHPTNHFEDYITEPLIKYGKIVENNVEILLNSKPDVILCNSIRIHAGAPTDNTDFDCNYENYKNEYFQLDTSEYRRDLKIEYYYDPYKPLNVFIKKG